MCTAECDTLMWARYVCVCACIFGEGGLALYDNSDCVLSAIIRNLQNSYTWLELNSETLRPEEMTGVEYTLNWGILFRQGFSSKRELLSLNAEDSRVPCFEIERSHSLTHFDFGLKVISKQSHGIGWKNNILTHISGAAFETIMQSGHTVKNWA